ncbi:MAG: hypothetical protein Fur003_3890 [Candidatus Dojkabacteria bacterium]
MNKKEMPQNDYSIKPLPETYNMDEVKDPTKADNDNKTATDSTKSEAPRVLNNRNVPPAPKAKGRGCLIGLVIFFMFTTFVATILFFGAAAASVDGSSSVEGSEQVIRAGKSEKSGKIVVIDIFGVIQHGSSGSPFDTTSVASPDRVNGDIYRAIQDPEVKAIVLEIESPGGTVVASDIIYNYVMEARGKKPIVAYTETMAASGGYYIAAGADEIVAYPSSITGSIGVIMQVSSMDELYKKIGIDVKTFKSARFKDTEELFDEDQEGELEQIFQEQIDEEYNEFVKAIVDGRGMNELRVKQLGDGRIYSGRQALKNGLVDYNGDFYTAVNRAELLSHTSGAEIVRYTHPVSFWQSLTGSAMSKVNERLNIMPKTELGIQKYYLLDM